MPIGDITNIHECLYLADRGERARISPRSGDEQDPVQSPDSEPNKADLGTTRSDCQNDLRAGFLQDSAENV